MEQDSQLRDFSFRDFLYFIKFLRRVFFHHLLIIFSFGILSSSLCFFYAKSFPTKFRASCRFLIKEQGSTSFGNNLGSLGALLSTGGTTSFDKTIAVLNTERLIKEILFQSIIVSGRKDLLINHFLNIKKPKIEIADGKSKFSLYFSVKDTLVTFLSLPKRKAYKYVIDQFSERFDLIQKSVDKKTGIVSLAVFTESEELSIAINELLIYALRTFMQEQATDSPNLNTYELSRKVDSIQYELRKVRKQLAFETDRSYGIILGQDKIDIKSLAVKEQILLTMYTEAQKNLEQVLFLSKSILNSTSLTILDAPMSPLSPIRKSPVTFSIIGFFVAASVIFLFAVLITWIREYI